MLKEREKFFAFIALLTGTIILAVLPVMFPSASSSETAKQVLVAGMGALTLALGAATNALFRIKEQSELDAVQQVQIKQPPTDPVPVDAVVDETTLPEYARGN